MQIRSLLVVLSCLWLCSALIPLKKQELDGKYQIGTIQDLFFGIKDKLLFRSDDDLFGFISQKDGQLMTVYELEGSERIVQFLHGLEVIIANGKKLNIFWPFQNSYVRSYETSLLEKHPNFTKIEDYQRTKDGALILTDKYLMQIPTTPRNAKISDVQERVLFKLEDQRETYFNIIDFFEASTRRLDAYITSLLTLEKIRQVCFRLVSQIEGKPKCIDLQEGEVVADIVPAGMFIYIELQSSAIVIKNTIQLVERLNSQPVQYFNGFVTIDEHKLYTPYSRTTHNSRIIVEHRRSGNRILTLQVQEKSMIVQKMKQGEKTTFETLVTIPKDAQQELRKVWSYSEEKDDGFRLYIEFEGGQLVCYQIDKDNKKFEEVWRITTVQAEKVANGKIEAEDVGKKGKSEGQTDKKETDINENQEITVDKATP